MAYKIEKCPGCGREKYLCWNCGKCPDCVDHRGTFSCVKPGLSACVLCGKPRYVMDGCTAQAMGVYSGFNPDDTYTFWACAECSCKPDVHRQLSARVSNMTKAEREMQGEICLD